MPEAATEDTRPHPDETAALRRRARVPSGAFSVISRHLFDDAGRVNISDVLETYGSMAIVLRLALEHIGKESSLCDEERSGLYCMTYLLHASFSDLDTMLEQYEEDRAESAARLQQHCDALEKKMLRKELLIAALRKELGETDPVPRRRSDAPASAAPAPDLTEPAEPPRAANG